MGNGKDELFIYGEDEEVGGSTSLPKFDFEFHR